LVNFDGGGIHPLPHLWVTLIDQECLTTR